MLSFSLLALAACGSRSEWGDAGDVFDASDAGPVNDEGVDALDVASDVTSDTRIDALSEASVDVNADVVDVPVDAGCSETVCGSTCVDLANDTHHCGQCAHDCTLLPGVDPSAVQCSAGACVVSACTAGRAHCSANPNDGGETDLTSPAHCGDCATVCAEPTPLCESGSSGHVCASGCSAGATRCGMQCVDVQTDPTHCGACGTVCSAPSHAGATCSAGVCGFACDTGYHLCGTTCVSDSAAATCGGSCSPCSAPANATSTCDGMTCGFACSAGYSVCSGACVNTSSAIDNCGACGTVCTTAIAHASATCASGGCGFQCDPGYVASGGTCVLDVLVHSPSFQSVPLGNYRLFRGIIGVFQQQYFTFTLTVRSRVQVDMLGTGYADLTGAQIASGDATPNSPSGYRFPVGATWSVLDSGGHDSYNWPCWSDYNCPTYATGRIQYLHTSSASDGLWDSDDVLDPGSYQLMVSRNGTTDAYSPHQTFYYYGEIDIQPM